jgi:hypothetical protein
MVTLNRSTGLEEFIAVHAEIGRTLVWHAFQPRNTHHQEIAPALPAELKNVSF